MAFTPSIAIFCLIVIVSSTAMESSSRSTEIVHEGQCPSSNLLGHIMCRRRVCLPEELIPLCNGDVSCPMTHKCCTPLCSCRAECVEAVHEN